MKIIQCTDAGLLAKLNKEVQDLHVQMYPDRYKPYNFNAISQYFDRLLKSDKALCFVCYQEEEPVGYCVIEERTYPENPFSREVKSVYIQHLNVSSSVRGQGVGHELMNFVKDFAQQKGVSRIELDVKNRNEIAKNFFTKMNYVPFNTMMELDFEIIAKR